VTAPANTQAWIEANQRYLVARLRAIRELLRGAANAQTPAPSVPLPATAVDATHDEVCARTAHGVPPPNAGRAARDSGPSPEMPSGAHPLANGAAAAQPADAEGKQHASRADDSFEQNGFLEQGLRAPAIDALCAAFKLSDFERDILLLCAGIELDSEFAEACAMASGHPQRRYPTFGLALAVLPDAHWSALTPAAPLRYWRLVELLPGDGLTSGALRIDERVLHYLTGTSFLDDRLQALLDPQTPPHGLVPSHHDLVARISSCLVAEQPPIIQLTGLDSSAKRSLAAEACLRAGLRLYALKSSDIPESPAERDALARLWQREALLDPAALLIDCEGVDHPRAAIALLERLRGVVFVSRHETLRVRRMPVTRFEVVKPTSHEQQQLWRATLGSRLNGSAALLVSQFDLDATTIRSVAAQVGGNTDPAESIWDACRTEARTGLDDLAQRVEPAALWDDLVLPAQQKQALRDIVAHVRCKSRVHDTWGFASKGARGLGLSALFAGASGTGKTMAAEVIAGELRLDLYRIDLSQIVSKYIGETEKNLRRVFDAAEASSAVLLFDEADALFGKRSEVKDSHDRYANIEVSYLLQRMECYRGLAILTTNMKSMLDPAFMRRLRFIVQFPAPDSVQRADIWRRVFPEQTPLADIDVNKLAQLNVAGGNIRNIATYAAFLAAETNEPVRMSHLLRAARGEYAKLDRQLTDHECRDLA